MRPVAHFCDLISGKAELSAPPPHNLRNQITKMRPAAHFCDLISGKAEFLPPAPNPGWATAAATATATEEFSQSIQAPSSTPPGISYPVRANPSLRSEQRATPREGICLFRHSFSK